jgi:hypothetical protein
MRLWLGVHVADVCEDFLISSSHQADFASAPYTDLFLSSQTKYVQYVGRTYVCCHVWALV